MGAAWRAVLGLTVAGGLLAACGATERNSRGGGGAAGAPDAPEPMLIDGVPIGDCREPTSETREPGCPAQPPQPQAACEAPNGLKACAYEIEVADGRASQMIYTCHPDQLIWGSGQVPCGLACQPPAEHVVGLTTSCSDAPVTTCRDPDQLFAFETAQQWLDSAFEKVLHRCVGDPIGVLYQLELAGGCPVRISSNMAFTANQLACLVPALGVRWDCAANLSCSRFLQILL